MKFQEGRVQCHAAMCSATCLNPRHVPGECCPRCEGLFFKIFLEVILYRLIILFLFYLILEEQVVECPYFECHLECPHGYSLNADGCPSCKCNQNIKLISSLKKINHYQYFDR